MAVSSRRKTSPFSGSLPSRRKGAANRSGANARPPATTGAEVSRVLEGFSHAGRLEASPSGPRPTPPADALGPASPAAGHHQPDLVLRRIPGRTLRGRPRLLRRLPQQTPP